MMNTTVAIIGGGASGLYAAALLSQAGIPTVLIEKNVRVGKKLLSTGNGRCNLTNVSNSNMQEFSSCYNHPYFAQQVFTNYSVTETLSQFTNFGLLTAVENGCVYPSTFQASTVLDVLMLNIGTNVRTLTEQTVLSVKRQKDGFEIYTDQEQIKAKYVLLCGGGLSAVKQNNCYALATELGHTITPCRPSLAPLKCSSPLLKALNGVRARCLLTLINADQKEIYRSRGEVLFKDYGISGIPVFCATAKSTKRCKLQLNFFPDIDLPELLRARLVVSPSVTLSQLFVGLINKNIAANVFSSLGLNGTMVAKKTDLNILCNAFTRFTLDNLTPLPYDMSQVTAGGVSIDEVLPTNMRSTIVDNLYICGELLDVHAICGGYNLQFAWSSAALATKDIISQIL